MNIQLSFSGSSWPKKIWSVIKTGKAKCRSSSYFILKDLLQTVPKKSTTVSYPTPTPPPRGRKCTVYLQWIQPGHKHSIICKFISVYKTSTILQWLNTISQELVEKIGLSVSQLLPACSAHDLALKRKQCPKEESHPISFLPLWARVYRGSPVWQLHSWCMAHWVSGEHLEL